MQRRRASIYRTNPDGKVTKALKKKRERKVVKMSAFATYLEAARHEETLSDTDTSCLPRDDGATSYIVQTPEHGRSVRSVDKELHEETATISEDIINLSTKSSVLQGEEFTTTMNNGCYFNGVRELQNPTEMILDKDVSLPVSVDSSDVSDEDISCDKQPADESDDSITSGEETYNEVGVFALSPSRTHVLLGINDKAKIFGRGYIKVLKGRVEVLGCDLEPSNDKKIFFAPVTDCALVVESSITESNNALNNDLPLSDLPCDSGMNVPIRAIENFTKSHSCVLWLSSLDVSDSKTYPGYPDLFKLRRRHVLQELCNGACLARTSRCFERFPSYIEAVDGIFGHTTNIEDRSNAESSLPVILTVGGKGTGKSTFSRYLVNKMLLLFDSINYLDCDIGQPEFTLPGFISLSCIKSPLLGPPFTHMQEPVHAVNYGRINCAGQPDRYIQCIKAVVAHRDPGIPLIVNTMGWIRGLGLNLLIDLIHMLQPSHIVQISSAKESKNLPRITRDFVNHAEGWHRSSTAVVSNFQHLNVETDLEIYEEPGYNPSDLRNLRVLSYLDMIQKCCGERDFGTSFESKLSLRSLSAIRPYKVKLHDVALYVCHESSVRRDFALAALNASLVGLSSVDGTLLEECSKALYLSQPPNCKCFGIAIVCGVDAEQKCLYIITHLPEKILKMINCLTFGSLTIPECMYESSESPSSKNDTVPPYVTTDFPFQVAGSGKFRVYRSK